VILCIADELRRARAIITWRGWGRRGSLNLAPLLRGSPKTEAEEAMEKLNREGLFHPMLFCEQEKTEARFLQHVWTLARQTKN
jgi:hypothetical protein